MDVKPTMSLTLKRQLYDFTEVCGAHVKDVAERLCVEALTSKIIMDEMCKWFRRNYYYNRTIVIGHGERPKLKLQSNGETGKVTIRFNKWDYDKLCELAFALDLTVSSTATVLIRVTLKNSEFMHEFIEGITSNSTQKAELKRFLSNVLGIQ